MRSRRLHSVYRKIMNNKAMTVVLISIVAPLVGLLMTSKGMPTPHYKAMRKMLMKLPFGNFLGKLIQQLVDVARRLLGIGIREGDVVQLRAEDDIGDKIAIRKHALATNTPMEDMTWTEYNKKEELRNNINIFEAKYVVYRIRNRKLQLILWPGTAIDKYSGEEVTKLSVSKIKSEGFKLLSDNNDRPLGFTQEHFKRADFQLDLTPE